MWTIDKVYIDGSCGSETVAGVFLARLKRVCHVTHFLKSNDTNALSSSQYDLALEFSMNGSGNILIKKKGFLSIGYRISNSLDPSMYTLSTV